jgi:DNA excision repair protein ERCC-1
VPRNAYALRVLLVWVDVDDAAKPLGEVTKAATLNEFTVVCAWSAEVGTVETTPRVPALRLD